MKKWLKITLGVVGGIIILFAIDLICIFTINRPLFAIKEDNGDSVNLIYRGLFYDTYNCHEFSVPQIKVKGAKYTCVVLEFDEQIKSNYKPTEIENISTDIYDISLTGATIVIKDTNEKQNTYTDWYVIEKEENGNWYQLDTKVEDYGFNDIAYLPNENKEVKFVMDWEWLYGKLPLGSYRILKKVNDGSANIISIEFNIATTS